MLDSNVERSTDAMNIGISEIVFLVINIILVVGMPIIIILAGFILFKRLRGLEARIEKLEARQNKHSEKTA